MTRQRDRNQWAYHRAKLLRNLIHPNRLPLEQLEPRLLLTSDFGDAPFPYPTTLAEDGARHLIGTPSLGTAVVDMEPDGVHSPLSDSDDQTGTTPDDEDGVTFGTIQVGALQQSVVVNVHGAPAKLDAWIDFNQDGSWGGSYEQIADSVPVVVGDNLIDFDVPSWAIAGTAIARFRLSTGGVLGASGLAADGEIEDHLVAVSNPTRSPGVFGSQQTITASADFALSTFAADVDSDGDTDVLSASLLDDKIAWYENDGSQNFTEHAISTTTDRATSVHAADIDGDGDIDVLSASISNGQIAWYENDGSQNFIQHNIFTGVNGAQSVFAADVDGDGDTDVLSASSGDDKISWHENDGTQNFATHVVSANANGARSVFAADVDSDGDTDVLSASSNDDKIAWYENDGSQVFTAHTISTNANGARAVFSADLDGDGDSDVLSASSLDDKIAWYENDGNQNFAEHAISTSAGGAYSAFAADLDGDGDTDVLSAARDDDKIVWFVNDGSQNFAERVVSTEAAGAQSVFAADVDGDGDLDVLSAMRNNDSVAWYENIGDADFGDAPSPYPTTLAENGPWHRAVGPTLGNHRDPELDGLHSETADFDDLNGTAPDDEDGVTVNTVMVGQLNASVTVNVQGATTTAILSAWVDFNGDGSWSGSAEQIARNVSLGNGDHTLNFDVPITAVSGLLIARFRLSTDGDLLPYGGATDGEIEDHAILINAPYAATGLFDGPHLISSGPTISISAADLDGDGDIDVLSDGHWQENDGNHNFTTHPIHPQGVGRGFMSDIDGDGDNDVLLATFHNNTVAWYENDGQQNFIGHTITTSADRVLSVFAADVDSDGDMDVLSASRDDNKIAWYENNGNENFTTRLISTSAMSARRVLASDVDGDGDIDVVSASYHDDTVAWYENDGEQSFTPRIISNSIDGANDVAAVDLDEDGDIDVLSAATLGNTISLHENDGNQNFTTHAVTTNALRPSSVFVADVDGDGDADVISESQSVDTVAWYENNGSHNFAVHRITTDQGARVVSAADVDGDGDTDVLASTMSNPLAWYENLINLDFGDAPTPYPTGSAENGPWHKAIGPTLGPNRDSELNGVHSSAADFDDLNPGGAAPDDEDGVTVGSIQVGQLGATATVNES